MIERRYGWIPSLPDGNRTPVLTLAHFPALPPVFDLGPTGFLPPIWDQGQTSSCTGHGGARAIAYARAKQGLPFMDPSRLFPYYNARKREGTTGSDAGASIADVIAAAAEYGDCLYERWPTDPKLVTVKPYASCYTEAIKHQALTTTRILGSTRDAFEYHFKHAIASLEVPPVFGFTVYESFESDEVARTGLVPIPKRGERIKGGHCVVARAYDDGNRVVKCDNSWSARWGREGSFYLPYDLIFNPEFASDFRAIVTEEA